MEVMTMDEYAAFNQILDEWKQSGRKLDWGALQDAHALARGLTSDPATATEGKEVGHVGQDVR